MKKILFILILFSIEIHSMSVLKDLLSAFNKNQLFRATIDGDFNKFKELINKFDINSQNDKGWSLLHFACCYNQIEIVQYLLELENINVNIKENEKLTPLHIAVRFGNEKIIKLLMTRHEINVNSKNKDLFTPLHYAVKYRYINIVKILLDHPDIDINSLNKSYNTPLHIACFINEPEIAKLLLNQKNINFNFQNEFLCSSLHLAAAKNNAEIVRLLLGTSNIMVNILNANNNSAFELSLNNDDKKSAKLFLENEEIYHNKYFLEFIENYKDSNTQKILDILPIRIIRDKDNNNLLHYAVEKQNLHLIKKILSEDINFLYITNKNGISAWQKLKDKALKYIEENNKSEIKNILLKLNLYYMQDENGNTILHNAIKFNKLDIVKLLLYVRPTLINVKNKHGLTPIHLALNNPDILKLFLQLAYS